MIFAFSFVGNSSSRHRLTQSVPNTFLFLGWSFAGIVDHRIHTMPDLPNQLGVELHRKQSGTNFGILRFQLVALFAKSIRIGGVEIVGFQITDSLAEKRKLGFVSLGIFGLGLVKTLLGLVIS